MENTDGFTPTDTIAIRGRTFEVQKFQSAHMPFILKNVKGTNFYSACRYRNKPELLHLVSFGSGDLRLDGNLVVLTDRNGVLEVA